MTILLWAYRFYLFVARSLKIFDETEFGDAVFLYDAIGRGVAERSC